MGFAETPCQRKHHASTHTRAPHKHTDTAGDERFRSLIPLYMRDTRGVVVVFDVTDRTSFAKVGEQLERAAGFVGSHVTLVVGVGTKADLPGRQVTAAEAQAFFAGRGIPYFETSARTGQNVEQVVALLTESCLNTMSNDNENHDFCGGEGPVCR